MTSGTKDLGFEYVRLDTNGQKTRQFLDRSQFKKLDEVAFSLDGYSAETNYPLRGEGTFLRAVDAIRHAIAVGYHVTITCCVQKLFLERANDGLLKLEMMIHFAESLGVHQINFHYLFKVGIPMHTDRKLRPTAARLAARISGNFGKDA